MAAIAAGFVGMGLAAQPALVPAPQKMALSEEKGAFVLTEATVVAANPADAVVTKAAADFMKYFPGKKAGKDAGLFAGSLVVLNSKKGIPAEGYTLTTDKRSCKIDASSGAGFFYAIQTLRQLGEKQKDGSYSFPLVTIEDSPRFSWRGLHIDDCRHFFGKEAVKTMLDMMAYHKLNTLHWHLTEDQGWRLSIDHYPELVKYGAVRPSSPAHGNRNKSDETVYGPFFYTKEDVKEIIAYAKARYITIVPEIELPGHARAALAAYPQFSCVGESLAPRAPWTKWGVSKDVFCAGNDEAIHFLEVVMDEVCELFDSPFIHIGGDECPKDRWKTCPKCQARIKKEGLKDEHELQSWVTKHFADYLAKKGRRIIGWDEILEGGVPASASVMSWRGAQGGIKAATAGHDVVMTPNTYCYFDYGQFKEGDKYEYIGGMLPLEKVYEFDPCAGIPKEQWSHVLGGQCNNWSEYTWAAADLQWKAFPRTCALAECVWTAPAKRDFAEFKTRLIPHCARLKAMGINVAPVK